MCGIAGIFSFFSAVREGDVGRMTDVLAHRGPDGEGHWSSPDQRISLGHRRLSIIDLSEAASQPMVSANGRWVIVLNGEIYNYIELRAELEKKGELFRSHSDTEVLLRLFETEGPECLKKIDGMFALAIYDKDKQELFCARDRFGEKPFFYSIDKDRFVFASEMKALFSVGVKQNVSMSFVYKYFLYLSGSSSDQGKTCYDSVFQLEPSTYMVVSSKGEIVITKYWSLNIEPSAVPDFQKATEEITRLFSQSVERRLRSDVAVGTSLSGGIDSSSVAREVNRISSEGQIQKTFSARFPGFQRDEGRYIQMVVENTCIQPTYIFPTAETVFDHLEKIWYHQEMPFSSASVGVQFEVFKSARENGVTVLLDGQGADEVFAGYPEYVKTYFIELFYRHPSYFYRQKKYFSEHELGKVIPGCPDLLRESFLFPDNALIDLRKKLLPASATHFAGLHSDIIHSFRREPSPLYHGHSLKEHLFHSLFRAGLSDLLRFADRNSMAHSVEVRLPFLSHSLVEYVFSLPSSFLIRDGWTKYILRKSVEGLIPDNITWRRDKIGYEPPQKSWLEQPWFSDIIKSATQYLESEKIIIRRVKGFEWQYLMMYFLLRKGK